MSNRRATWAKRCTRCLIQKSLCFCDAICELESKIHVSVIIHQKERFLPSNTARFIGLNFPSSNFIIRGEKDHDSSLWKPVEGGTSLYLYPDEEAISLSPNFIENLEGPIQLIIPDGTWSQAKKIKRRMTNLKNIQSIKIPDGHISNYTLRKQKYEHGLCTYEACAIALGILDSPELAIKMLEQFEIINSSFAASRPI